MFKDLQDLRVAVELLAQPDFVETRELLESVETEARKVTKVSLAFLDFLDHRYVA